MSVDIIVVRIIIVGNVADRIPNMVPKIGIVAVSVVGRSKAKDINDVS